MERNKNRIIELDLFKGLAIILMVCGHLVLKNWEGALDYHPVYTWIYSFHMPLFFFISGFLIDFTFGSRSPKSGLRKKALALLVPYFVGIYVVSPFIEGGQPPSLIHALVDSEERYWFVYLLFIFSFFYYIGRLISNSKRGVLGGGSSCFIVFCRRAIILSELDIE